VNPTAAKRVPCRVGLDQREREVLEAAAEDKLAIHETLELAANRGVVAQVGAARLLAFARRPEVLAWSRLSRRIGLRVRRVEQFVAHQRTRASSMCRVVRDDRALELCLFRVR
jgi:hypothetical protein